MSRLASVARPSLCLALLVLVCTRSDVAGQTARANVRVDREYTLESTMVGYRGVGGEIDGVRNPTLWARTGETVRIGIVNGELMVHDIALENLGVKSQQILDKGATTSITFKAEQSDTYYCTRAGPSAGGHGGPARRDGRAADQLRGCRADARRACRSIWTSKPGRSMTGRPRAMRSSLVKADRKAPEPRMRARERWALLGQQPARRQCAPRHAQSVPFLVTHPFASFLAGGRRVQQHAHRARRRRGWPAVLHHLRRRSGRAAAGRRRPPAPGRQVDLSSGSWTMKPARRQRST